MLHGRPKLNLVVGATIVLALAIAASCGGDSTSPPVDIVGTYSIRTVDGRPVPDTARGPADTTILNSETFIIRADLTFEVTTQYIITHDRQTYPATGDTRGTYEKTGRNTFSFTPDQSAPPPLTAVVNGNTLTATYPNPGHTFVYVYTR